MCLRVWWCVCAWARLQLQSCVSLWMCKCHPTISPPPLSLTSIAISEAAVEAALFWQMLTLSKCISEDVMALVTLPLPPSLSISSLLFFTLTVPSLPRSMHGFKVGIYFWYVTEYYSQCHFSCALSSNFTIWYPLLLHVHKAHVNVTMWTHQTIASASRPRCDWTVQLVSLSLFLPTDYLRGGGFEDEGRGWMRCQEEKVCSSVATRITYLDTMRPLLMWTSCWLTGRDTWLGMQCEILYTPDEIH